MQHWVRAGLIRWCAAILVALLAFSMLHAAAPHHSAQRDCATCKALTSPGVAQISAGLSRPSATLSRIDALPEAGPLSATASYLRPLRAPPDSPVI
jgi:hypothetical protein